MNDSKREKEIEERRRETTGRFSGSDRTTRYERLASYAYPIGLPLQTLFRSLDAHADPVRCIIELKDAFEAVVKYAVASLLGCYVTKVSRTKNDDLFILTRITQPSLGQWVELLYKLTAIVQNGGANSPILIRNEALRVFADFVPVRNEWIGHGARRSDREYLETVLHWQSALLLALEQHLPLAGMPLILCSGTAPNIELRGATLDIETGEHGGQLYLNTGSDSLVCLHPFLAVYPCKLCGCERVFFCEGLKKYDSRKNVKLVNILEYAGGHKAISNEPIPAFEKSFSAELLSEAFNKLRNASAIAERVLLDFGSLFQDVSFFIGRQGLFDFISSSFAYTGSTNRPGFHFVILGEPGSGKTSLVVEWLRRNQEMPHFFFRRESDLTPRQCIRHLCAKIGTRIGLNDEGGEPDFDVLRTRFLSLLDYLSEEARRNGRAECIVIDALDEAGDDHDVSLILEWLPKRLPANVHLLLTGRPTRPILSFTRSFVAPSNVYVMEDHSESNRVDAWQFLQLRIGERASAEQIERIVELSEGNFLYIHHVTEAICTDDMDTVEVDSLVARLEKGQAVTGLTVVYELWWEKLVRRVEASGYRGESLYDFLGLLAVASDPLTDEQCESILELHPAPLDFYKRNVVQYLESNRVEEQGLVVEGYRLYHSTFRDFVANKMGAAHVRKLHRRIVNYYLELTEGWTSLDLTETFRLQAVADHLRQAQLWEEAPKFFHSAVFSAMYSYVPYRSTRALRRCILDYVDNVKVLDITLLVDLYWLLSESAAKLSSETATVVDEFFVRGLEENFKVLQEEVAADIRFPVLLALRYKFFGNAEAASRVVAFASEMSLDEDHIAALEKEPDAHLENEEFSSYMRVQRPSKLLRVRGEGEMLKRPAFQEPIELAENRNEFLADLRSARFRFSIIEREYAELKAEAKWLSNKKRIEGIKAHVDGFLDYLFDVVSCGSPCGNSEGLGISNKTEEILEEIYEKCGAHIAECGDYISSISTSDSFYLYKFVLQLCGLANVAVNLGQCDKAEGLLDKAERLWRRCDHEQYRKPLLYVIAVAWVKLGDRRRAMASILSLYLTPESRLVGTSERFYLALRKASASYTDSSTYATYAMMLIHTILRISSYAEIESSGANGIIDCERLAWNLKDVVHAIANDIVTLCDEVVFDDVWSELFMSSLGTLAPVAAMRSRKYFEGEREIKWHRLGESYLHIVIDVASVVDVLIGAARREEGGRSSETEKKLEEQALSIVNDTVIWFTDMKEGKVKHAGVPEGFVVTRKVLSLLRGVFDFDDSRTLEGKIGDRGRLYESSVEGAIRSLRSKVLIGSYDRNIVKRMIDMTIRDPRWKEVAGRWSMRK